MNVDDRALPVAGEDRTGHESRQLERHYQVDLELAPELLRRLMQSWLDMVDTRVVHQNVDPSVAAQRGIDEFGGGIGLREVTGDGVRIVQFTGETLEPLGGARAASTTEAPAAASTRVKWAPRPELGLPVTIATRSSR